MMHYHRGLVFIVHLYEVKATGINVYLPASEQS
jgi:hypothetical protein